MTGEVLDFPAPQQPVGSNLKFEIPSLSEQLVLIALGEARIDAQPIFAIGKDKLTSLSPRHAKALGYAYGDDIGASVVVAKQTQIGAGRAKYRAFFVIEGGKGKAAA